jgi:hypothetical protein
MFLRLVDTQTFILFMNRDLVLQYALLPEVSNDLVKMIPNRSFAKSCDTTRVKSFENNSLKSVL